MNKTQAIKEINKLPGIHAKSNSETGEIRVVYRLAKKGAKAYAEQEASAYYTTDPQDALDTAKMMANEQVDCAQQALATLAQPTPTATPNQLAHIPCIRNPGEAAQAFTTVMEWAHAHGVFRNIAEIPDADAPAVVGYVIGVDSGERAASERLNAATMIEAIEGSALYKSGATITSCFRHSKPFTTARLGVTEHKAKPIDPMAWEPAKRKKQEGGA